MSVVWPLLTVDCMLLFYVGSDPRAFSFKNFYNSDEMVSRPGRIRVMSSVVGS